MSKMRNQELNSSLSRSHSTAFLPHHSPLHISFVVTLITEMAGQFFKLFLLENFNTWVVFYQEFTHQTSDWTEKK